MGYKCTWPIPVPQRMFHMKLMVLLLGGLFSEESGKDWTIWKKGINNGGSSMKHGKRNTDDDSIDEDGHHILNGKVPFSRMRV